MNMVFSIHIGSARFARESTTKPKAVSIEIIYVRTQNTNRQSRHHKTHICLRPAIRSFMAASHFCRLDSAENKTFRRGK